MDKKSIINIIWFLLLKRFPVLVAVFAIMANCSCTLIKKAAGADFDVGAYQKARQARIAEIKLRETAALLKRAANSKPAADADIVLRIGSNTLNKIALQYIGAEGWLDEDNSFVTDSVFIELRNGYGIISLKLRAWNHEYGIDVFLVMDCLAIIKSRDNEIYLALEPFNISPAVETGFLLSGLRETIQNLLLLNLGELGSKFKGIKIPLNFDNSVNVKRTEHKADGLVKAAITLPDIAFPFSLKLDEVIFLEGELLVTFNFIDVKGGK